MHNAPSTEAAINLEECRACYHAVQIIRLTAAAMGGNCTTYKVRRPPSTTLGLSHVPAHWQQFLRSRMR